MTDIVETWLDSVTLTKHTVISLTCDYNFDVRIQIKDYKLTLLSTKNSVGNWVAKLNALTIANFDENEPRLELFDEETEHTLSIIPWIEPERYVRKIPSLPSKPPAIKQEDPSNSNKPPADGLANALDQTHPEEVTNASKEVKTDDKDSVIQPSFKMSSSEPIISSIPDESSEDKSIKRPNNE